MIVLLSNALKKLSKKHGKRTLLAIENATKNNLWHLLSPLKIYKTEEMFVVQYKKEIPQYAFLPSDFNNSLNIKYTNFEKAIKRFGGMQLEERIGYQTGFKLQFKTEVNAKNFIKWYNENVAKKARLILARHDGV